MAALSVSGRLKAVRRARADALGTTTAHQCNLMRFQVVKTRQLSTFCDAYAGSVK